MYPSAQKKQSHYLIDGQHVSDRQEDCQDKFKKAYDFQLEIKCLCRVTDESEGVLCYLAKLRNKDGTRYIVKRMPQTGGMHHAECEHYGLSDLLTGKSALGNDVIVEEPDSGITILKINVPLKKQKPSTSSVMSIGGNVSNAQGDSTIRSTQSSLNLIGLMHYFLDATGLTKWSPNMLDEDGKCKRNYGLIRYLIMKQASVCHAKKSCLGSKIFIPPRFHSQRAEEN